MRRDRTGSFSSGAHVHFYLMISVWNMKTKKIEQDLPGHGDEVYAVDWAPDGERVASGGKDKVLRL